MPVDRYALALLCTRTATHLQKRAHRYRYIILPPEGHHVGITSPQHQRAHRNHYLFCPPEGHCVAITSPQHQRVHRKHYLLSPLEGTPRWLTFLSPPKGLHHVDITSSRHQRGVPPWHAPLRKTPHFAILPTQVGALRWPHIVAPSEGVFWW